MKISRRSFLKALAVLPMAKIISHIPATDAAPAQVPTCQTKTFEVLPRPVRNSDSIVFDLDNGMQLWCSQVLTTNNHVEDPLQFMGIKHLGSQTIDIVVLAVLWSDGWNFKALSDWVSSTADGTANCSATMSLYEADVGKTTVLGRFTGIIPVSLNFKFGSDVSAYMSMHYEALELLQSGL